MWGRSATSSMTKLAGFTSGSLRTTTTALSSMDSTRQALDARITLRQVPAARVAALRFRGWAGEASVAEHKAELAGIIAEAGLVALGEPTVAQYNPPWTLPFLRRNEILVAVGAVSG